MGRRTDKPSDPPTKKDVALAAWQATVTAKLENIETVLTTPDPEVKHNTARLDSWRNVTLAVILAVLGLLGVFLTTCTQNTSRAAETRTTVGQHDREIVALRKSVSEINGARTRDTERVIEAIKGLRDAQIVSEAGVDCTDLSLAEKVRIRAILGNPHLCTD